MIEIKIKKDGVHTHGGLCVSQEEANNWINRFSSINPCPFGKPEYTYQNELTPRIPAVLDENGVEISPEIPATYETITVPAEFTVEFLDITEELEAERTKRLKIEAGAAARNVCQQVLDLVAGDNLSKALTIPEITQLQATFANTEAALRAGRPTMAKQFITAIEADGVLVTEELKATALDILKDY